MKKCKVKKRINDTEITTGELILSDDHNESCESEVVKLGNIEDVEIENKLQDRCLISNSKHFSTLNLCDDIKIDTQKFALDCKEERQESYFLYLRDQKSRIKSHTQNS